MKQKDIETSKTQSANGAAPTLDFIGENLNFATTEAYNLLRTNIAYSLPDTERGKIIGITSPRPQEGKSYTSINLTYTLAKDGKKAILVDADMRRSNVCDTLALEEGLGLSDCLIDLKANVIRKNVLHENMSVITAGQFPPPNPSELIGSQNMVDLIENLAKEYDYVLVDLPPVNSVSDPLIVSGLLDGFIVIIRHEASRKKEIKESIRQLRFVKAHILGFVYNGYRHGHGHYGRYYKKYRNDYYSDYYKRYDTKHTSNTNNKESKILQIIRRVKK